MIVIAACIPHHTVSGRLSCYIDVLISCFATLWLQRGKGENPGLSLNAKNIRFQDDASTNERLFGSVKYSRLGYPD